MVVKSEVTNMETVTTSPTQSDMMKHVCPRQEPCTRACTQSTLHDGMQAGFQLPVRQSQCPLGFSLMQIAICSVLKTYQGVIAYWQIASIINTGYGLSATTGAVRGALERLDGWRFLQRRRASIGKVKGNCYAFTAEPCPHIRPFYLTQSVAQSTPLCDAQLAAPSVTLSPDMIDRKNLSISSMQSAREQLAALTGKDLEFHWPRLTAQGFGLHQIRQIVQRLDQTGTPLDHILQGLTHAEWELEHDGMRDKDGAAVKHPVNWLFKILARQGYYPRPANYVSPQEQAERDATLERERMVASQEARREAAFVAWLSELSDENRATILATYQGSIRMPERVLLRNHYFTKVWSKHEQCLEEGKKS